MKILTQIYYILFLSIINLFKNEVKDFIFFSYKKIKYYLEKKRIFDILFNKFQFKSNPQNN